jgi:hypothetical protein
MFGTKRMKEKINNLKKENEKLIEKNESLENELKRTLKLKYEFLGEDFGKIKELLKGYEFMNKFNGLNGYNITAVLDGCNHSIPVDCQGYLMTDQYIPTFEEFYKKMIDKIDSDKRLEFYKDLKPVFKKYITDERDLRDLENCMLESFKLYKPNMKKVK